VTRIATGDWGRRRSEGLIAAQHPHEAGNLTAGGCERLLTIAADPVVIFEILSESTAKTDCTTKLVEYQSLPSVQRYVLLEQDQAVATVITRGDAEWTIKMLDVNGILAMPEIDVEIAITELYEGLELTPLNL